MRPPALRSRPRDMPARCSTSRPPAQNFADPIKIECNLGSDPICDATLPPTLQALINGEPLDWTLLLQALPEILANLEQSLDGAAQDVHIPLIGDTLDAGADVVGTFNDGVVVPLAALAAQLTAAGDQDGDSDVDAYDLAKLARQFVLTELGPSGADLLRNTNGIPGDPNADGDIDDIVITPLCGSPAVVCADGEGVTLEPDQGLPRHLQDRPGDRRRRAVRHRPPRPAGAPHRRRPRRRLLEPPGRLRPLGRGRRLHRRERQGAARGQDREAPVRRRHDRSAGRDERGPFGRQVPPGRRRQLQRRRRARHVAPEHVTSSTGCRVTKIEIHKLWCDDFGTAAVEGVDWHGTDGYELRAAPRARHARRRRRLGAEPERVRDDGRPARRRRLHLHRRGSRLLLRRRRPRIPRRLLGHALPCRRARVPRRHDPRHGGRRRLRSGDAADRRRRRRHQDRPGPDRALPHRRARLPEVRRASASASPT